MLFMPVELHKLKKYCESCKEFIGHEYTISMIKKSSGYKISSLFKFNPRSN